MAAGEYSAPRGDLAVNDEHLDMAIRIGTLPDSSMIATRIGAVRHVICASPHSLRITASQKRLAHSRDFRASLKSS